MSVCVSDADKLQGSSLFIRIFYLERASTSLLVRYNNSCRRGSLFVPFGEYLSTLTNVCIWYNLVHMVFH